MQTLLLWIGRIGGLLGVLVCAIAILMRLRGVYNFAGFQIGTLLLGGVAAMVVGCLGYAAAVAERRQK
jgi:lipid-binding SYLF domain-containing protein